MDVVAELAVREAMFEELDRRIAQSGDGNLSWKQTERFSCFGETYAMRQARGKGINKPRQLERGAFDHYGVPRPEQPAPLRGLDWGGRVPALQVREHRSKPLDESGHEVGNGKLAFPSLTSSASARPSIDPSTRCYVIGEDPRILNSPCPSTGTTSGLTSARSVRLRRLRGPDDTTATPPAVFRSRCYMPTDRVVHLSTATSRTARCRAHHRRRRAGG